MRRGKSGEKDTGREARRRRLRIPRWAETAEVATHAPDHPTEGNPDRMLQMLAAVATALWRMRSKLADESATEMPFALRNLPRHIQAACDALKAGGVEVVDPSGQSYVAGMAVTPIAFQPVEGVLVEVIHETIKPTVFYKNRLIQRADVIVARPMDDGSMATQTESDGPDS
jgi:hypothetical protein